MEQPSYEDTVFLVVHMDEDACSSNLSKLFSGNSQNINDVSNRYFRWNRMLVSLFTDTPHITYKQDDLQTGN